MRMSRWMRQAAACLFLMGFADCGIDSGAMAQEPRRGGVVRMTAPYASSFGNLDPHRSGRSQDGQVHMTIHRITRDEAAIEALEADLLAFAAMVDEAERKLRAEVQEPEAVPA